MSSLTKLKECFAFLMQEVQGKKLRKKCLGAPLLTLFFGETAYYNDLLIFMGKSGENQELYEKMDFLVKGMKDLDFHVQCFHCKQKANHLLYYKRKFLGFSFVSCGKPKCNFKTLGHTNDCTMVSLDLSNLLTICPDASVRYELSSFLKQGWGLPAKYNFSKFNQIIVEKLLAKGWQ